MKRLIVIVSLAAAAPAGAQLSGIAAVDSATTARAAYRRAAGATDAATAYREVERASRAWPTQPAYLWARATLAARARDTAATLAALDEYASLSLGRDLAAAKDFAFLTDLAAFKDVARRHEANRAPWAVSRVVREAGDSAFWPEGIDFDPATGSFYLGGIRRGTIMRIDSAGRATTFWAGDGDRRRAAVLGVRVDVRRRVLWATTSGIPQRERFSTGDTANASLLQIDLDDGVVKRRWDLVASPGGNVLGDLAVGPDGDVFFTDSRHPVLYRLRPGMDTLEATTHRLFYSLQGLAPAPDGRSLYLADYSHGLLRVDLRSGAITRLADAPRSTSLGCDGITWHRGSLICVQNGVAPARIMRFTLDAGGLAIARAEVIDRNFTIADEPTIGTMAGDEFVYVANSQWEKHDDAGKRTAGAPLRGPVLLGVRIR